MIKKSQVQCSLSQQPTNTQFNYNFLKNLKKQQDNSNNLPLQSLFNDQLLMQNNLNLYGFKSSEMELVVKTNLHHY